VSYEKEGTGEVVRAAAGRMECMMQNLADSLTDIFDSPQNPEEISIEKLSTFMVSNVRRKVTSSAKKKYKPNGPLGQTPEGSFRDLMLNARDLLGSCGVQLPEVGFIIHDSSIGLVGVGALGGGVFDQGTFLYISLQSSVGSVVVGRPAENHQRQIGKRS